MKFISSTTSSSVGTSTPGYLGMFYVVNGANLDKKLRFAA